MISIDNFFQHQARRLTLRVAACLFAAVALAAPSTTQRVLELTPADTQGYEWVRNPTQKTVAAEVGALAGEFAEQLLNFR